MVEVYAIKLDQNIEEVVFRHVLSVISKKKQQQIQRFKRYEDAQRSFIGELLVRYIICTKYQLTNQDLTFLENSYGKPILDCPLEIHFNISHSCEWVVCAISSQEIGIDIEKMEPINISIAKKFFNVEEYQFLLMQKEAERVPSFYQIWCAKESYVKAIGVGLSISLDAFTIGIVDDAIVLKNGIDSIDYYLKELYIDLNYKLIVCSKIRQSEEKVEVLPLQQVRHLE